MPRKPGEREPLVKLVFISELYILEAMQLGCGMYTMSPEQLLILLEEKIESGELTLAEITERFLK